MGKSLAIDGFFDSGHVASGNWKRILAMFDGKLHGAGPRDDLLDLLQVDKEGAVATYDHGIGPQVYFHLLGSGAEHVGAHWTRTQLIDFYIVPYSFNL